jgi:hypothetical protein
VPGSRTRRALIALQLFVLVTAIGGGIALGAGLEGGRFPLSWLAGTPFADYAGPGLILVGWIVGEIVLVSADNELVSPMEALYLVVSLAMIGLTIRLGETTKPRAERVVTPKRGPAADR